MYAYVSKLLRARLSKPARFCNYPLSFTPAQNKKGKMPFHFMERVMGILVQQVYLLGQLIVSLVAFVPCGTRLSGSQRLFASYTPK